MTVKEILKLNFGYPIQDSFVDAVIQTRKLAPEDEFVSLTPQLWLAKADLYKMLALAVEQSDDSGDLNLPPREMLLSQAENIYRVYEPESAKLCSKRAVLKDVSSVW